MKIRITYTEYEQQQADKLAALFRKTLEPDAAIREKRSSKSEPYSHIYLNSRNIEIPRNMGKNTLDK